MEPVDKNTEQPVIAAGRSDTWTRGLVMLVLMFAFGVGQSLLYLTALMQFFWLLLAKKPNKLLMGFGKSLALWLAETARFLCCAKEEKPFPWTAWPSPD